MYGKIVTHNDFDGVVSAAICSYALKIGNVFFTGPSSITKAQVPITERDIVCDLPYPLVCGMWFDHHEGNLKELGYRGIDLASIKGRFALKDSCSRVVYEYFSEERELPEHFIEMVEEADLIDAFNYPNVQEWRKETSGKIIDYTLKLKEGLTSQKEAYMRRLVFLLRDKTLQEVASLPDVRERYERYRVQEEQMLEIIKASSCFLPSDINREIVIIDLTKYNKNVHVIKNLAYLLYPNVLSVIEVRNLFSRGIKTNDLSFSMSLSLNLNAIQHNKDVGEIMRSLNLGDGHRGAAAGIIYCNSKSEMLKKKGQILQEIYRLWSEQG